DCHVGRQRLHRTTLPIRGRPGGRRRHSRGMPGGHDPAPIPFREDTHMSNGLNELRIGFAKVLIGVLWTMVALVTATSLLRGNSVYMTAGIGILLAGLATVAWRHDATAPLTRYISSSALSGVIALLVLEFSASRFQIDMHMAFYAGLAVVAVWCCWMSVVLAGAVIALHHLALNFVYPYAVFPDGSDLSRVLIHAVIVSAQVAALAYLTNRLVAALDASAAANAAAQTAQAES